MIIQSNIDQMKEISECGYCPKFNCWGATQYALGHRKKYGWVGEQVMWRWLKSKTVLVSDDHQVGDILVISDNRYNQLIHTAVYLGDGIWFHKEGKFEASFHTKQTVIKKYTNEIYFWGERVPKIEIYRLKTK
jgi:cell wall-associated NlpC family hydrolase